MGLASIIQSRIHLVANFRDFIFDICRHESKLVAGKVAILLWFAWQNRNNKVWNDSSTPAQQAVNLLFFKKIPKPMSRVLMVSFKTILVINKVNSKTPGESGHPFKVVQK
jgi:hypothetical protein